mgnify:CR=1 FL=1
MYTLLKSTPNFHSKRLRPLHTATTAAAAAAAAAAVATVTAVTAVTAAAAAAAAAAQSATEYGANWPKAWHHWALFNCGLLEALVKQGETGAARSYVAPAVTGFFRR